MESELIRQLDAEWRMLAQSRCLRDRLRTWAAKDDRLVFDDGDQLIAATQRRDVSSWAERDQALAALLERAPDDALARRVALQVVLPGLKSLVNGIRGWDVEERAARVVATALDVISWSATEPAGTPPSFRIYTNGRRFLGGRAGCRRERQSADATPTPSPDRASGATEPDPRSVTMQSAIASRSAPLPAPYVNSQHERPR